jgi:glyoxylase-like metal-dependent hydrolase (beta-lactamase superfamily II)
MALPDFVEPLGGGVYLVDTGYHRPRFCAAYLVVQHGCAAVIDTGTHTAVPRIVQALAALGLAPEAVEMVIPTHVHLDHAGGAFGLMQVLPRAVLWVHPRGVRHMVDPTALRAGAVGVYGEEAVARDYGALPPVPAERVRATHDGQVLELAGRPLRVADTPGHARHHHCLWDEATRGWFTGDTFGLSYRELDTPGADGLPHPYVLPTTTPVQFEPDALADSVRRLLTLDPAWLYLTHYGRVGEVPRLGAQFLAQLAQIEALAQRVADLPAPARDQALQDGQLDIFAAALQAQGGTLSREALRQALHIDLSLNAAGIAVWLDKRVAAPAGARSD